jgi:hypothetical protein
LHLVSFGLLGSRSWPPQSASVEHEFEQKAVVSTVPAAGSTAGFRHIRDEHSSVCELNTPMEGV